MAVKSTITQKTVGTARVQLTADVTAAATKLSHGVKVANGGTGLLYWGGSTVTTTTGKLMKNGVDEIHPGAVEFVGDIWFISDTAGQVVSCEIVGQTVTIS